MAVLVLEHAGVPMSREDIVAEFKTRAVVDPRWDKTEAAIHQAIYRAVQYKGAAVLEDGRYVATAAPTAVQNSGPPVPDAPMEVGPPTEAEGE